MHLTQLFDRSLRGRARRVGLEYLDQAGTLRALTFGEVDERASRMAHELIARGLARGDRLCVHLANCVEFIDVFLACARTGVILVPMNALYRDRELRHIIGDAQPVAVIARRGSDVGYPEGTPIWDVDELSAAAAARSGTRPEAALDGSDPALIVYTSGTTGAAKGAVLTHDNLAANGLTLTSAWALPGSATCARSARTVASCPARRTPAARVSTSVRRMGTGP